VKCTGSRVSVEVREVLRVLKVLKVLDARYCGVARD